MTREEAINKWIVPAIKNTWNEKKCKEIMQALESTRPKGKWKTKGLGIYHCPLCGFSVKRPYDFCVCGADMRGTE